MMRRSLMTRSLMNQHRENRKPAKIESRKRLSEAIQTLYPKILSYLMANYPLMQLPIRSFLNIMPSLETLLVPIECF